MARRRSVTLLNPTGVDTGDPLEREREPDDRAPRDPLPGQEQPELDDEELQDDGLTPEERDEIALAQETADTQAEAKQAAAEDAEAAAAAVSDGDADPDAEGLHPYTRAKYNLSVMRRWASRADLYRVEPKEYKGQKISGFIRRFEGNFDLSDIQLWARKNRGRGDYQILIYDGKGILRRRKDFECEGRIILPEEAPDEEDVSGARQRTAAIQASDDRATLAERQLAEERFERRLAEERSRNELLFERMTASMREMAESVKAKPAESPKSLLDGLAPLAPVIMEYLKTQREEAAAARATQAEAAKAQAEANARIAQAQIDAQAKQTELLLNMQEKAEARMAKALEATNKRETLADMLKGAESLKKLIGGENSEAKAFNRILDTALPKLIDATTKIQLHKAGVGDGGKEETLAERIVGSVTDLAEQALPALLNRPTHAPTGFGVPAAPTAPGAPQLPAPPPNAVGTRGGGQIVTPEQQAAHEAAERAAKDQRASAAAAALVGTPAPPPPPPAAAPAPAPASATAPPPGSAQLQDVNYVVFDKALAYMAEGKLGSELAYDLMQEEEARFKQAPEAPPLYFTKRFLTFVSNRAPESVVSFILPYLAPHPAAAPLLDEMGQEFLRDFCRYFSEEGEEPSSDDAEATDAE